MLQAASENVALHHLFVSFENTLSKLLTNTKTLQTRKVYTKKSLFLLSNTENTKTTMLIHTLRRSLSSSVPRQVSRRTLSTQSDNFLEGFGADRFDDHAMAQVLDSSTLEAFKRTRASGEKMDKGAANSLAEGMAKVCNAKICLCFCVCSPSSFPISISTYTHGLHT